MVETKSYGHSSASTSSGSVRGGKESVHDEREDFQVLVDDVSASVSEYCRHRPMVAGMALFAFGFYVGWRIKPW